DQPGRALRRERDGMVRVPIRRQRHPRFLREGRQICAWHDRFEEIKVEVSSRGTRVSNRDRMRARVVLPGGPSNQDILSRNAKAGNLRRSSVDYNRNLRPIPGVARTDVQRVRLRRSVLETDTVS